MKQPITAPVFTPEAIDWQQQVPFSPRYGDRYHTTSGARAQAVHVFLGGCGLPARWQAAGPTEWLILETGFGLGLNFLSTWAAWRATADRRPARLRFVSTEAHPVLADDLRRACRQTDATLLALGERLAERWPIRSSGQHGSEGPPDAVTAGTAGTPLPAFASAFPSGQADGSQPGMPRISQEPRLPDRISLDFEEDGIHLDILLGDARQQLDALYRREGPLGAHSVFLDGFDPAKNPAIWHPDTLHAVARHCHPAAQLATWSVARTVRDALQAAGFRAVKRPGLPPKRDCLAATLTGFDPAALRQAPAETDTR